MESRRDISTSCWEILRKARDLSQLLPSHKQWGSKYVILIPHYVIYYTRTSLYINDYHLNEICNQSTLKISMISFNGSPYNYSKAKTYLFKAWKLSDLELY